MPKPAKNPTLDAAYVAEAHRIHHVDGEVEVDHNAKVSRAPGQAGAYVQAWVWVDGCQYCNGILGESSDNWDRLCPSCADKVSEYMEAHGLDGDQDPVVAEMKTLDKKLARPWRPVASCAKCGTPLSRWHRKHTDEGTGPEAGKTFTYCSIHCMETH